MGLRTLLARLAFRVRVACAWTVVEVTGYREVEKNDLTGAYRWRHINMEGEAENNGPWMDGAPAYFVQRALCEAETTMADIAQMFASETDHVQRIDFGTPDLTGYAVRRPDGTVITWRDGEPAPHEAAHIFPSA